MDFTDEELMLIEQITYLNKDVVTAANAKMETLEGYKTVGDLLAPFDAKVLDNLVMAGTIYDSEGNTTYMTGEEWAAIISEIQNNEKISSLSIYDITTTNEDPNDKSLRDKTKIDKLVLCQVDENNNIDYSETLLFFRGTLDAKEWYDNAQLLVTGDTKCNKEALEYVNTVLAEFETIRSVGHSKGANKAAYVFAKSEKVVDAVLMDAPGAPKDFYENEDVIEKAKTGHLRAYALSDDFVNILMFQFLGIETTYCKGYEVDSFFENHCPNSFFKMDSKSLNGFRHFAHDEEENLILKNKKQSVLMKCIHGFTTFAYEFMPYDVKVEMADYLGNAMAIILAGPHEIGGVTYSKDLESLGEYLDTNPEMLTTLLAYIQVYKDYYLEGNILKQLKQCLVAPYRDLPFTSEIFRVNDKLVNFFKENVKYDIGFKIFSLDPNTMDYINSHFQEKYDEICALPNMGSIIEDPHFPYLITDPVYKTGIYTSIINEPLYLDEKEYDSQTSAIKNAASMLTFETSVFEMEQEICGTESLCTLTDYWHKVAKVTELNRLFSSRTLAEAMLKVRISIDLTNRNVADALEAG